jgi:hypothetical protein
MNTKEAFKELIFSRSVWKTLGISSERIKYFRNRIKYDKPVESDKMDELLIKAGWKVKQEKQWEKP